jgi:DNA processing protein
VAFAAALADLPGMGPARLAALLRRAPPEEIWELVLCGEVAASDRGPRLPGLKATPCWADVAAHQDPRRAWAANAAAGIHATYLGGPGFPDVFADDPQPPGVVFWRGDLGVLDQPCVAIVGTRQCTSYGRGVAMELGRDLAQCGVCVVSGLALGIDGAAHLGALSAAGAAGPLGVAASGVDVPYPPRHAELWHRVAAAGAIISETAPGRPAQAWRFPTRNRLIAGLSRAVVVVESHASGGSMLTVAAAADRGIDVLAVPGPVTSASSAGTNQLLHEGLAPVRHAGDVLAALGDLRPWPPTPPAAPPSKRGVRPSTASGKPSDHPGSRGRTWDVPHPAPMGHLDPSERRVLDSIDRTPTATSVIADRTGLPVGALSVVLLHLEARGLVRGEGAWWERHGEQ